MKMFSRILFPAAVTAALTAAAIGPDEPVKTRKVAVTFQNDTVIYAPDAYKLRRVGDFEESAVADSLLDKEYTLEEFEEDTIPRLSARDTIFPPDSLKEIDPFRYEFYVALLDSATHRIVSDSLRDSHDTLFVHEMFEAATRDSLLKTRLDSTWVADSTARAIAAFNEWYNSLSKEERKAYDFEQKQLRKKAEADSLKIAQEDRQALKDSILKNTPRILETFYFPEEMQYKRIVEWQVDQDFHSFEPKEPDTTFNYHFYDYPIFRNDLNATWLGVGGSPAMSYNFFRRDWSEDVEFYNTSQIWSYNPGTLRQYNTKTPHTELAYYGTLLGGDEKESDNLHILTTQNISPEFNFTFLFELHGGGGMLENEKTSNKTTAFAANYVGKKYLMNAGIILNNIQRNENGGITDNYFVRDTSGIDSREFPVALSNASSKTKKTTFFLDQQYRIPFDFINRLKARKDSTLSVATDSSAVAAGDTLIRDITTAFIGHSSEYSRYSRTYEDAISSESGREFFNNVFLFNPSESADSMGVEKLDNKVFLRLQPWASDAVVSKLNLGVGDLFRAYFDSTSLSPTRSTENSVYLYAGAEGKLKQYINWNAKGHFYAIGAKSGDFDLQANLGVNFYPFRRAKNSPISLNAHFETSLKEPNHYQQLLYTNHFSWQNEFGKISTTKFEGTFSIPRWKLDGSIGYALLSNNIYYDTFGIIQQNSTPMSVLSAYLHKDFVIGNLLHLDNKVLFQKSSDAEVLPLPELALNLRYYIQFPISKGAMVMQIGANAFYNSRWYSPAFNPVLGVFHNQNERLYENGPYMDIFINMQWKRACVFIKYQNFLTGWPMEKKDYFSADRYIITTDGTAGLKLGIFWPFYTQPGKPHSNSKN